MNCKSYFILLTADVWSITRFLFNLCSSWKKKKTYFLFYNKFNNINISVNFFTEQSKTSAALYKRIIKIYLCHFIEKKKKKDILSIYLMYNSLICVKIFFRII